MAHYACKNADKNLKSTTVYQRIQLSNNKFINVILGGYAWLGLTVKWNGLVFHIINRTLHGHLEIWNFSSHVENISLMSNYSPLEEKFRISARPCTCNILYICLSLLKVKIGKFFNCSAHSWVSSKENWRESSALYLWNPGYPAYDIYEKQRFPNHMRDKASH